MKRSTIILFCPHPPLDQGENFIRAPRTTDQSICLLARDEETPRLFRIYFGIHLKVTTDVHMQAISLQKCEAQSKLVKMVIDKGRLAEQASA